MQSAEKRNVVKNNTSVWLKSNCAVTEKFVGKLHILRENFSFPRLFEDSNFPILGGLELKVSKKERFSMEWNIPRVYTLGWPIWLAYINAGVEKTFLRL